MIDIVVSDYAADRLYRTPPFAISEFGRLYDTRAWGFFLDPSAEEISLQFGPDVLLQGSNAMGPLRDKDVTHIKTSGNFAVFANVPWSGEDASGNKESKDEDGNTYILHRIVPWGFDSSSYQTWDSGSGYFNGKLRWRDDEWQFKKHMIFHDNQMCFIVWRKWGSLIEEPNKVIVSSGWDVQTIFYRFSSQGVVYKSATLLDKGITDSFGDPNTSYIATLWPDYAAVTGTLSGYYYTPQIHNVGTKEQVLETFKSLLTAYYRELELAFPLDTSDTYGELALECAEQFDEVNANVLLMAWESYETRTWLVWLKRCLKDEGFIGVLSQLYTLVKEGKWSKEQANNYLAVHYGFMPTVDDFNTLFSALNSFLTAEISLHQRVHARRQEAITTDDGRTMTVLRVLTVDLLGVPDGVLGPFRAMCARLRKFGMLPSLSTAWGIVPYSFVVNWIVNFGKFFEQMDHFLASQWLFQVSESICSEKWTHYSELHDMLPGVFWASGAAEFTRYMRWVRSTCPSPTISDPEVALSTDRWIEALALIIQRKG